MDVALKRALINLIRLGKSTKKGKEEKVGCLIIDKDIRSMINFTLLAKVSNQTACECVSFIFEIKIEQQILRSN